MVSDADDCRHHVSIAVGRRERGIEGPAGIKPTRKQRVELDYPSRNKKIPAQEVQFWKGQISCAHHQRDYEVAKCDGHSRNEEKPDHHHPVNGEEPVVGFRRAEHALGHDEIVANERRGDPANKEEDRDRTQIKEGDAFVVGRQKPTADGRCAALRVKSS